MIKFKSNHNNWESCLKHWPTWFKSEDNFIKKCPGIMKYFQSGIVILSKEDYKFSVDGSNVQFYNYNAIKLRRHYFHQMGLYSQDRERAILKFDCDIWFKADEGDEYQGLFLPYDNINFNYRQIDAIQPVTDNWQPIITNMIFENGYYHIKKGQPLCKMLFFKNEEIDINNEVVDDEEIRETHIKYHEILKDHNPHTGDYYNIVKKVKACPHRKQT